MKAHLLAIVWLLLVWLALLGDLSPLTILTGVLLAVGLVTFFRPSRTVDRQITIRPLGLAIFMGYFLLRFIRANIQVALAVIDPARVRDRRAVISVPIAAPNDIAMILLANAISLTPGTFILEMRREPPTLYVHVLQITTLREARLAILELERYVVRAVESPGAIERVEELMRQVDADASDGEGLG